MESWYIYCGIVLNLKNIRLKFIHILNDVTWASLNLSILEYFNSFSIDDFTFFGGFQITLYCSQNACYLMDLNPPTISKWLQKFNRYIAYKKHSYFLRNAMFTFDCTWKWCYIFTCFLIHMYHMYRYLKLSYKVLK